MNFKYLFRIQTLVLAFATVLSMPLLAETLISSDGREIKLNTDGTWEVVSNDIYTYTSDGKRIKLKEDGTWEYIGNVPVKTEVQHRDSLVDVSLKESFISEKSKKAGISNNVRTRYFLNLTLEVALSNASTESLDLESVDSDDIKITGDGGESYPVTSLDSNQDTLAPGQSAQLTLVTKGAPGGAFNASKVVFIDIDSKALKTEKPVRLQQTVKSIEKRKD